MKVMTSLRLMRYLSFEINHICDLSKVHVKCPSGHPERYLFGSKDRALTDDIILGFWRWCRYSMDFHGIILWDMYNEPTLSMDRILNLMVLMKRADPGQPFQLFTNKRPDPSLADEFDLVKFTDYGAGKELDDRLLLAKAEGKPYAEMQRTGWCGRCFGWTLNIDNYGNWCLCCQDWRCEEAVGNIFTDDWYELFDRFKQKSRNLRWHDEESYNALPRMCRACLTITPNQHRSGATF